MKRYKKLKTKIPQISGQAVFHDNYTGRKEIPPIEIENVMMEDPAGEWMKWKDVGIEIARAYADGFRKGRIQNLGGKDEKSST